LTSQVCRMQMGEMLAIPAFLAMLAWTAST
jgi:hypothetical protein